MRQNLRSRRQVHLRIIFIAATLVIALDPASARTDRTTESQPTAQDFYDRGVAERKDGHPDDAIVLLSLAAAREPDNADIRLQLALAFIAVRRIEAAERQLRRAERLAPGYVDVKIALAYVDLFQGRTLEAEVRAKRLLREHPERDDVIALADRFKPATPPRIELLSARKAGIRLARFDGLVSYTRLSGGRPPWREAAIEASFETAGGNMLSATLEQASRFDRDDTFVAARLDMRPTATIGAYVTAGASATAAFKPKMMLGAGSTWDAVTNEGALYALRLTAGARYALYDSGDVTSLCLGVETEFLDGSVMATAQSINVLDETGNYQTGQLVQIRLRPSETLALRGGWANAPDTSDGRTFATRSVFAGVQLSLSPQLTASASYAHDELEGLYDRSSGTLALSYRLQPS